MTEFKIIAKTFQGLEEVLAKELINLGANNVEIGRRMVAFTGDKEMLYKANFCTRTAVKVLKPIKEFKAKDADEVYEEAKKIDWEKYMDVKSTFLVDSVIFSENFRHSKFVAYRVKDAIADYWREKSGGDRPNVVISNPDLRIHVHIAEDEVTIALDSSGESLHQRGYKTATVQAPLNEVLAAGLIMLTGWDGECDLIDPFCGSGTILIEAALIAQNVYPGVFRKEYAFEKWKDFDADLFDRIYNDDSQERTFDFLCYGSDISQQAIDIALENIRSAGLVKYINLKTMPFQQYQEAPKPGILVMNPPYGERISSHDLMGLYSIIGERLKHVFTGYQAWIISYKEECFEKIGLRPCEKMKLMNGSLECEYRCYEMFEGKNKDYKKALNEQEGEPERRPERGPKFNKTDRPDFTRRMDRPERRFAAAHSENEEERLAAMPGRRRQREEQERDSEFRRGHDSRPAKMRYRDEEERPRGDHKKSFGDRDRKRDFGDREKAFGGFKRDKKGDHKRDGKRPFDKRGGKSNFKKDFREDEED